MPGTTSKLGMYLPGGGSEGVNGIDEKADIDKLNDDLQILDDAAGFGLPTSTTRPNQPFLGQAIVEQDTKRALYWNGAGWTDVLDNASNGLIPAGSTSDRDAYWGTPASVTAKVALANQGARWFNTDNGYEEKYYAETGQTGVVGRVVATGLGGWYPNAGTALPWAEFTSVAPGWPNNNEQLVGQTATFVAPWTEVSDNGAWHDPATNPTRITPKIAGNYEVSIDALWGVTTAQSFVKARKNSATTFRNVIVAANAESGLSGEAAFAVGTMSFNGTTDYVDFTAYMNSGANGQGSFHILLTYKRPPIV